MSFHDIITVYHIIISFYHYVYIYIYIIIHSSIPCCHGCLTAMDRMDIFAVLAELAELPAQSSLLAGAWPGVTKMWEAIVSHDARHQAQRLLMKFDEFLNFSMDILRNAHSTYLAQRHLMITLMPRTPKNPCQHRLKRLARPMRLIKNVFSQASPKLPGLAWCTFGRGTQRITTLSKLRCNSLQPPQSARCHSHVRPITGVALEM